MKLTRFFDSGVAMLILYLQEIMNGKCYRYKVLSILVRITASLTQTADNPDDLFDNRAGLKFDSASSNFDGDTSANCNAHIEIANLMTILLTQTLEHLLLRI